VAVATCGACRQASLRSWTLSCLVHHVQVTAWQWRWMPAPAQGYAWAREPGGRSLQRERGCRRRSTPALAHGTRPLWREGGSDFDAPHRAASLATEPGGVQRALRLPAAARPRGFCRRGVGVSCPPPAHAPRAARPGRPRRPRRPPRARARAAPAARRPRPPPPPAAPAQPHALAPRSGLGP